MTDSTDDVAAQAAALDNDPDCPKIQRPDVACEAWLNQHAMETIAKVLGLPDGAGRVGPTHREMMQNANCLDQAKMAYISGFMDSLEQLKEMALFKARKLGIPIPHAEAEFGPIAPTVEAPTTKP